MQATLETWVQFPTPGDPRKTPGRSPGVGNGNPLHYSCLENSTDRRVSWATTHRVAKSQTRLSTHTSVQIRTAQSSAHWRGVCLFVASASSAVLPFGGAFFVLARHLSAAPSSQPPVLDRGRENDSSDTENLEVALIGKNHLGLGPVQFLNQISIEKGK